MESKKSLWEKVKYNIYVILYDWWLFVGMKMYLFLGILFDTKDWVKYEYMVDGKLKNRKYFRELN